MTMVRSGKPYPVSATGTVVGQHAVLQNLICVTAGTIQLYDTNTGTAVNSVLPAIALTTGQVVPTDMNFQSGIYAVVTSGTYVMTVA